MKTRDWLVIGVVLGGATLGIVLWEKHVAASAPVGMLVTGGRYQIVGPVPPGTNPQALAATLQANYPGQGPGPPQWSNVTVNADASTYTVQATYTGPGTPVPAGLTVTKIG